jgi:hypothetical protein
MTEQERLRYALLMTVDLLTQEYAPSYIIPDLELNFSNSRLEALKRQAIELTRITNDIDKRMAAYRASGGSKASED